LTGCKTALTLNQGHENRSQAVDCNEHKNFAFISDANGGITRVDYHFKIKDDLIEYLNIV
jgi:hypothetical protein